MWVTWREAMTEALYSPGGFYARGEAPHRHFRTSVHACGRYAGALAVLAAQVDAALGHPARFDVVDIGAGRGELLSQLLAAAEPGLAARMAAHAVEVVPRPDGLSPRIGWHDSLPTGISGLVIASEWLDNVPLDVAVRTPAGPRLMLVDTATGAERRGPVPPRDDLAWLHAWWPLGERAEIGRPRCAAWAGVVRAIERGVAVAADYAHTRATRPGHGTLTGYLHGRATRPVPDGSRDVTAHVALDACAAAGQAAGAAGTVLTTQRAALRALGVTGSRPPVTMAASAPQRYVQELSRASEEGEITDPTGLGAHGWLVQAVAMPLPAPLAPLRACA